VRLVIDTEVAGDGGPDLEAHIMRQVAALLRSAARTIDWFLREYPNASDHDEQRAEAKEYRDVARRLVAIVDSAWTVPSKPLQLTQNGGSTT
jgi:hypothetical protein